MTRGGAVGTTNRVLPGEPRIRRHSTDPLGQDTWGGAALTVVCDLGTEGWK
jgi:hypothetical protein